MTIYSSESKYYNVICNRKQRIVLFYSFFLPNQSNFRSNFKLLLFLILFINFYFLYFMNMYIGNLSYRVKEADLRQVMEEYGTVDSVKLIIDRDTRKSKGFAFVEMPNDAEAKNVISELNGTEYEGRAMVVKEALPRN